MTAPIVRKMMTGDDDDEDSPSPRAEAERPGRDQTPAIEGGTCHGAAGATTERAAVTKPSTRASSRKNRVHVLREFLLATYPSILGGRGSSRPPPPPPPPSDAPRRGGAETGTATTAETETTETEDPDAAVVVLDVAGGKGDLSWILANADGVRSVIFDPRLPDHAHLERSVTYLRGHPAEAASRAVRGLPTYQPLAELLPRLPSGLTRPGHVRIHVDDELVQAVGDALKRAGSGGCGGRAGAGGTDDDGAREVARDVGDRGWDDYFEGATARARASTPLGYRQTPDLRRERVSDAAEVLHLIRDARLVVGFHPDQATEACVDLAVLLGVPFAVCPCCVFPSEFPHRRTAKGDRVTRYEDFVSYLRDKYPSLMRVAELDFVGKKRETSRNLVLYTLPEDMVGVGSECAECGPDGALRGSVSNGANG